MTYQLKRSLLYCPASRIDRVTKVLTTGTADVVVADLEDGTAPGDRPQARKDLENLLAAPPKSRALFAVRINALGSQESKRDLETVAKTPPPALVVPKVEDAKALADLSKSLGKWNGAIFAQIETAKGLLRAESIAATPGVVALIFGSEDYAASIGAIRTPEATEVLYARSHVVACSAAAGADAIDQIWADFKDEAGLRRDALAGARLGFAGKQLIHPDQIQPTHESFAPTPKEVEKANRIVAASDAANGGVAVVDGRMIDRPLVEQARRVLRRSQAPK